MMDRKRHFLLGKNGRIEKYIYPRKVISNDKVKSADRIYHGKMLLRQLEQVKSFESKIEDDLDDIDLNCPIGVQVSFESFPGIEILFERLADVRSGIELLSITSDKDVSIANISVPIGKFPILENKIKQYLDPNNDGKLGPKNAALLNNIENIRKTVIKNLWTDNRELYPKLNTNVEWFEIWIPVLNDRVGNIDDFKRLCLLNHIESSDNILEFPERTVLLVHTSLKKLTSSVALLSKISEIRKAKTTAEFFSSLDIEEEREWVKDLLNRAQYNFNSRKNTPYISILDTGINIGHPLLAKCISSKDLFVVDDNWSEDDEEGHGTSMAGLAIWGDLTDSLSSSTMMSINHKVESIKLLRHPGDNQGKHLGNITASGISLSEISHADRKRIYTMALSAEESMDRGTPSAWSSEIDSLAVDYMGDNLYPRLFLVCAGNTGNDLSNIANSYPQYNELQDIQDPGQSWNAITVGAFTDKIEITDSGAENYSPLAPNGGLSPFATTSVIWKRSMPLKPEVVFEGGNMGVDQYSACSMDSLLLLSIHFKPLVRMFSTFNATSAATALAAKFASEIWSAYPNLWPESVRGIMVHSASWTKAMIRQFRNPGKTERQNVQHLLRCVGYGVPDLTKALWSVNNSLSIIIEDSLQPFEKLKGKSEPSTRDMHIHDIPWPKEQLLDLGETPVTMTVTLSYFIEPNPSSRNISNKYRYPSHQLRFDVKRPTESPEQFVKRLSRAARDEEEGSPSSPSDPNWLIGDFRNKGSIHKDEWHGTAADLAERGLLAVYPAMGWWRTRKKLERYNKEARYSLIISIETPSSDVDLYSTIETIIRNQVPIKNQIKI